MWDGNALTVSFGPQVPTLSTWTVSESFLPTSIEGLEQTCVKRIDLKNCPNLMSLVPMRRLKEIKLKHAASLRSLQGLGESQCLESVLLTGAGSLESLGDALAAPKLALLTVKGAASFQASEELGATDARWTEVVVEGRIGPPEFGWKVVVTNKRDLRWRDGADVWSHPVP